MALTYEAASRAVTFYINGRPAASDTTTRPFGVYDFDRLLIGRGKLTQTPEYFRGIADEIRIYNQALTEEELSLIARPLSWPAPIENFGTP